MQRCGWVFSVENRQTSNKCSYFVVLNFAILCGQTTRKLISFTLSVNWNAQIENSILGVGALVSGQYVVIVYIENTTHDYQPLWTQNKKSRKIRKSIKSFIFIPPMMHPKTTNSKYIYIDAEIFRSSLNSNVLPEGSSTPLTNRNVIGKTISIRMEKI